MSQSWRQAKWIDGPVRFWSESNVKCMFFWRFKEEIFSGYWIVKMIDFESGLKRSIQKKKQTYNPVDSSKTRVLQWIPLL